MATRKVSKNADRAWVGKDAPNLNHEGGVLRIRQGAKRGLCRFDAQTPKGVTVLDAFVEFERVSAGPGPVTIRVQRLSGAPKVGSVTWATAPDVVENSMLGASLGGRRGARVAIDVAAHLQAVADGEKWHGHLVTTDADSLIELRPVRMVVNYSTAPAKPVGLAPSSGAIGGSHPRFTCVYDDAAKGATEMAAMRVQVAADEDAFDEDTGFSGPVWDSGAVPTVNPMLDSAAAGFSGLGDGANLFWSCIVQDGDGLWSEWADPVPLRRRSQPTLTILTPSGGTTGTFTPDIQWSFPGQVAYRVFVTDPAAPGAEPRFDTGKTNGGTGAVTLPAGVIADGRTYRVTVMSKDGENRESVGGDQAWVSASVDFAFAPTGVTPPTNLDVTQDPDFPGGELSWSRGSAPSSWTVLRDGSVIAALLDADDVVQSGSRFTWTDRYAPSGVHAYEVAAVEGGQTSASASATWNKGGSNGTWLVFEGEPYAVRMAQADLTGFGFSDVVQTYEPVGGQERIEVTVSRRSRSGQIIGLLTQVRPGYITDAKRLLKRLKEEPALRVTLVAYDISAPVHIKDLTWGPSRDSTYENPMLDVSFTASQRGRHEFHY